MQEAYDTLSDASKRREYDMRHGIGVVIQPSASKGDAGGRARSAPRSAQQRAEEDAQRMRTTGSQVWDEFQKADPWFVGQTEIHPEQMYFARQRKREQVAERRSAMFARTTSRAFVPSKEARRITVPGRQVTAAYAAAPLLFAGVWIVAGAVLYRYSKQQQG